MEINTLITGSPNHSVKSLNEPNRYTLTPNAKNAEPLKNFQIVVKIERYLNGYSLRILKEHPSHQSGRDWSDVLIVELI